MAHPLYWVTALTCAIPLALILLHDRQELNIDNKEEKAFHKLLIWVLYFCLQDIFWGVCAGATDWGNTPLFIASTLFHTSTVLTTFFWLNYVLIYLGDHVPHRRLYLGLDIAVITLQLLMLTVNLFQPVIFSVRDGLYCTELLRPLAFFNQYVVYLLIGILMLARLRSVTDTDRERTVTVLCFSIAPILTGIFQLLYPDAPFYTIGYFLGTIIIHLFIVQNERVKLRSLHHEMENQANRLKIAEQIALSNTDILTGLYNRRAYEQAISTHPLRDGFAYVSVDVNELKTVNDTLGHDAGDELLLGAAECIRSTLGQYGEVYRIGGDEFAALLYPDQPLPTITAQMMDAAARWHGKHVNFLSLSFGTAEARNNPGITVVELAKLADEQMYANKAAYYISKGVDRRGMQMAYSALCASYQKILRVDLNQDSFHIIAMNGGDIPGYEEETTLSGWLEHFGRYGMVHPDDLEDYLAQTSRSRMKEFFSSPHPVQTLTVFYRRLSGGTYRQTMMEILPAEDFTPENPQLYLYVKNIDRIRYTDTPRPIA